MTLSNKFLNVILIILFLSGCGGGSSDTAPIDPGPRPVTIIPPAKITMFGLVSDDPLSEANITVRDLENRTLGIGTTDGNHFKVWIK